MELVWYVYLIDVLTSIGTVASVTMFVSMMVIGLTSFVYAMTNDGLLEEETKTSFASVIKIGGIAVVTAAIVGIATPSKDTMYLMAGAYAGTEVAKHESMQQVPEILTKTMKIINKELDKRLEETK